jgi:FkbM family methyltransferase
MLQAKNKYGLYSIPKEIEYTYTAQTILEGNVHEDTTIEYIQSVGGNIIHGGTGFGDFLPALKNCDSVWTFEPNPLMYECSKETISLNNQTNVHLFDYALGDYNGYISLSNMDDSGREMGPRSEIGIGIKVDIVTLDSIIPENTQIDLIHLDIEGYELNALKGAKNIIEKYKPIIVLEIDCRAVTYNEYMDSIGYNQYKQLIYNSNDKMVFVNTVYKPK